MRDFVSPFCVFVVALLLAECAEGVIRVAVQQEMCNRASEAPTFGKNILEQINSLPFMQATYVQDADIDTTAELAAYDVVYMGPGGSSLEDDKLSVTTANALLTWVNSGKGVVFSALASKGFSTARAAIAPLMPVIQSDTVYWCKPTGAPNFGYPRLKATTDTYSHFIFRNTTNNEWNMNAWSFFTPAGLASGTTSLASIIKFSGTCCHDLDTCGVELTQSAQGIAVKTYGSGRVAWFAAPYCGYDLYQPGELRFGNDNAVFLNAIEWASGLCRAIGDCNGHGHCTGSNTCLCDSGWGGDATCTAPSCTQPCVHGTCTAPNTCTCYNYWYGPTCNSGCLPGWFGSNCSVSTYIRDESFSAGAVKTHWSWEAPSPIISTNQGYCDAGGHTGSYRACFLSSTAGGTDYVQQGIYIFPNATHPAFLSFWVRSSFSAGSPNKLYVKLDGVTIHTEDISNAKSSYTQVVIDLSQYTTTAAEHVIRFEAVGTAGAKGVFEVDDVTLARGSCPQPCVHGHCDYVSVSSSQCDCDEHYTGSTCSAAICGDSYLVLGLEPCDDGNTDNGDGCSNTCAVERGWECTPPAEGITSTCTTVCGDGNVTPVHEACDDHNTDNDDGCNSTCSVEIGWTCGGEPSVCTSVCGDGVVASNEGCDDMNFVNGDGCSSTCQIESGYDCYGHPSSCELTVCPNSRRTRHEGCDDGNIDNGDGCNSACQIEHGWECTGAAFGLSSCAERCGNGMQTISETCDDGNTDDGDGCSANCLEKEPGWDCTGTDPTVCVEVCGNGYITKSEECDDGGVTIGCNASCKVIPGWHCLGWPTSTCAQDVCGNGALEPSEFCDDNNVVDGDGCSSTCELEEGWACNNTAYGLTVCAGVCGNGYRTMDEECDDGNRLNSDGCDSTCIVELGYECLDLPSHQSFCRFKCGNGIVITPEECDDGNMISSDGCTQCKIDEGFVCEGSPSNCTEICGDGLHTPPTQCDDNNTIPNDGCTNCKIDKGFTCTGTPSVCYDTCGDGIISLREECDDHNTQNGDGCSSTCKIETTGGTWRCVGEPSDCRLYGCPNNYITPDEECDDGDTNNTNGCTTSCKVVPGWDCGTNATQPSVCRFEVCGDGYTTKSEGCDDGNLISGDCCNKTCGLEFGCSCTVDSVTKKSICGVKFICGNGFTTFNETCDDGNQMSGDGCSSTCTIETGWVCETTNVRPSSCHPLVCGDGLTEGVEECDDGNLDSGDGCSANCTIENGFTCRGSLCRNYCGNGVLFASTEECDDGNRINGDGCNSTCGIEAGWNCTNATDCTDNCRSVCWSTCGDGRIASNEECDDGNTHIGDGCTHKCEIESFWKCIGVPSVCIVKKCDLAITSLQVTDARCGGSKTGEITVTANGTGAIAYKLVGGGRELPPWEDAGRWINLGGATYTVMVILDGDENCKISQQVNVSQPRGLSSGQITVTAPKTCDSADGALTWTVYGGTPPYTYTMGNKNSSTGVFTELTNLDWDVVIVTDAHLCQLATPRSKIPPKQECEYAGFQKFVNDIWARGGPAGLAIICVTAGIVGIGMIGYCIWDHHATRREEKEDAAAERAEAQTRAQQSEIELIPAVSTLQ